MKKPVYRVIEADSEFDVYFNLVSSSEYKKYNIVANRYYPVEKIVDILQQEGYRLLNVSSTARDNLTKHFFHFILENNPKTATNE